MEDFIRRRWSNLSRSRPSGSSEPQVPAGMQDAVQIDASKVRSGLYLGSQAAETGPLESLTNLGIASVLQLGTDIYMNPTHSLLTYRCMSVPDNGQVDIVKQIIDDKALDFLEDRIRVGAVLVHCQMGRSRSATAVLAYLMTREGLSFEDALVDLMRHRRVVQPNLGFCNQLKGLEECQNDVSQYKGPAKFLSSFDDWIQFIDRMQSQAGLQF